MVNGREHIIKNVSSATKDLANCLSFKWSFLVNKFFFDFKIVLTIMTLIVIIIVNGRIVLKTAIFKLP